MNKRRNEDFDRLSILMAVCDSKDNERESPISTFDANVDCKRRPQTPIANADRESNAG